MKISASELMVPPKMWSREDLPRVMTELGLLGNYLEVGVQRGWFAGIVRSQWGGAKYFGCDPWIPYEGTLDTAEMHTRYMADAHATLEQTKKPYELFRIPSLEFAALATKNGWKFQTIFLDGNHDYQPLMDEVVAFWPLLQSGGLLLTHDYIVDGIHRDEEPFTAYQTYEEAGGSHCGPFQCRRVFSKVFPAEMIEQTSPESDRGWQTGYVRKL